MNGFARRSVEDTRRQPRLFMPTATRLSPHVPAAVMLLCCTAALSLAAPAKLPTAGQVLDRYVNLTGGAAAWKAKQTEATTSKGGPSMVSASCCERL